MTGATDIWAVVPIKETARSKQRLADFVPAPLRPGLALAMFEDGLSALAAVPGLAGIIVVTADDAAAAIGRRYGARILAEDARTGHNAAVAATARRLARDGCGGMLQLPGDIPLATSKEIELLLKLHRPAPSFTIAPAHDNLGSNAILVSPPGGVPLSFGENSFFPHLRAARQHGIEPTIVRLPGIGRDIDVPDDMRVFSRHRSATRTQAFLDANGFGEWGCVTAETALEEKPGAT